MIQTRQRLVYQRVWLLLKLNKPSRGRRAYSRMLEELPKCSNILHRGRDGKKRELCGPGFCAINCRYAIYRRVKITHQPRLRQGVNCSQPKHVSVCMHTGLEPIKPRDKILYSLNQLVKGHNQEPKPEEITPTFRTPPRWVKIGTMKLHVGS